MVTSAHERTRGGGTACSRCAELTSLQGHRHLHALAVSEPLHADTSRGCTRCVFKRLSNREGAWLAQFPVASAGLWQGKALPGPHPFILYTITLWDASQSTASHCPLSWVHFQGSARDRHTVGRRSALP